jgi:hypothetical protein
MNAIKKALILKNYLKLAICPVVIVEFIIGITKFVVMLLNVAFVVFNVLLESTSIL